MSDPMVRRVTDVNARIRAEHHKWGVETYIRCDAKEDYSLIPWDLWERLIGAAEEIAPDACRCDIDPATGATDVCDLCRVLKEIGGEDE